MSYIKQQSFYGMSNKDKECHFFENGMWRFLTMLDDTWRFLTMLSYYKYRQNIFSTLASGGNPGSNIKTGTAGNCTHFSRPLVGRKSPKAHTSVGHLYQLVEKFPETKAPQGEENPNAIPAFFSWLSRVCPDITYNILYVCPKKRGQKRPKKQKTFKTGCKHRPPKATPLPYEAHPLEASH